MVEDNEKPRMSPWMAAGIAMVLVALLIAGAMALWPFVVEVMGSMAQDRTTQPL